MTLVGLDDAVRYGWVDPEVAGTTSILNTKVAIKVASLVVGDPREWSVFLMDQEKRIHSSFDDCTICSMSACSQG